MTYGGWRFISVSEIGTSHIKREIACQDRSECRIVFSSSQEAILVAACADGAGSAIYGGEGAELACSLFFREMEAHFSEGGAIEGITPEFMQAWIESFQNEVKARADENGTRHRDYATTFLAAIIGADCGVFFQCGDGAIVTPDVEESEAYAWIFWPHKSEYENETCFITDEPAILSMEYDLIKRRIDEVALFSDGLQRQALHYKTRTAFSPFFKAMLAPLTRIDEGPSEHLTKMLKAYLSSSSINERTDDDKTLILASRRAKESLNSSSGDVDKDESSSDL